MLNSSTQPIDLETLLSQHSNNPIKALNHLISQHNDLLKTHQSSVVENLNLWKTLRASSSRQNLEGLSSSKENGMHSSRGPSSSSASNGLSGSIRKLPFLESTSPQLQLPTTDLSTSPNQHFSQIPIHSTRDGSNATISNQLPLPDFNNSLRKGASLDLIRPSYRERERELSPNRSPKVVSSSSSVRPASDLSSSASMPVLNNRNDDSIST